MVGSSSDSPFLPETDVCSKIQHHGTVRITVVLSTFSSHDGNPWSDDIGLGKEDDLIWKILTLGLFHVVESQRETLGAKFFLFPRSLFR